MILPPPIGWVGSEANPDHEQSVNALAKLYHELWREIHCKEDPDEQWFSSLLSQVPNNACGCFAWLLDYVKLHPPRFADWFAYSWELHNAVNAKLGKLQQSLDDSSACWLGIAPHTKPRLIITIATGARFVELLALTRPLMEEYASKCDADFIAITNQQFEQWQREKFRVFDFAQQYEQTLFLDSDVLVKPIADNIFETYKEVDVSMHDDLPLNPTATTLDGSWNWRGEYADMLASQDIASYKPDEVMWNSGVVLTSKRGASIWKPPTKPLPTHHCSEQFFVQHNAQQFAVANMDSSFNWQFWFPDFEAGVSNAQFVHLANCPNRIEHIRKYI